MKGGAPQQGGGGQYGGGAAQQQDGAQPGGGQQGGGGHQGGGGGHQGGGGGGGGNGLALLRFHGQGPVAADWGTFLDALKSLKDGKGTQLCRNAVYKAGGYPLATCQFWHPDRGTRDAREVLDAVKAAVPNCKFDAL